MDQFKQTNHLADELGVVDTMEIVIEDIDQESDDQAQVLFYRSTSTCTTTC